MKSCRMTRDGMNGISASSGWPGRRRPGSPRRTPCDSAAGMAKDVLQQDPDDRPASRSTRSGSRARRGGRDRGGRGRASARAPKGSIRDNASILIGSLHSMRGSVPRSCRRRGDRPGDPMKAWGPLPGDGPGRDRAETEAAIADAGIDLDPVPPGHHRHGEEVHPDGHAHPHRHAGPGERPTTGIIGGVGGNGVGDGPDPFRLAGPRGRQPRPGTAGAVRGGARWGAGVRRATSAHRGGRARHRRHSG